MKIIRVVTARCRCDEKLAEMSKANERAKLPAWANGTMIQCDCGVYYTLADSQRDGQYWRKSTHSEVEQAIKSVALPSEVRYTLVEGA